MSICSMCVCVDASILPFQCIFQPGRVHVLVSESVHGAMEDFSEWVQLTGMNGN